MALTKAEEKLLADTASSVRLIDQQAGSLQDLIERVENGAKEEIGRLHLEVTRLRDVVERNTIERTKLEGRVQAAEDRLNRGWQTGQVVIARAIAVAAALVSAAASAVLTTYLTKHS